MTTHTNNSKDWIDEVLENLTEQVSLRMLNMQLAPEITSKEILELEAEARQTIQAKTNESNLEGRKEEILMLNGIATDNIEMYLRNRLTSIKADLKRGATPKPSKSGEQDNG